MKYLTIISSILTIWLATILASSAQDSAKTVSALVVGMSDYEHMHDLKSSATDTRVFAEYLEKKTGCQFPVSGNQEWNASVDLTRAELVELLGRFRVKAATSHISIFYYSGHSAQVGDEVYLLAKDAMIADSSDMNILASDIKKHGIPLSSIVTDTRVGKQAMGSIFIIDGCRTGARITKDKANVSFDKSIVAFSASPRQVAQGKSDYTLTLVESLTSGASIKDALMVARDKIIESTDRKQKPQLSIDAEADNLSKYVLSPAKAIPVDSLPITGSYKGKITFSPNGGRTTLSERTIIVNPNKSVTMSYEDTFPNEDKVAGVSGKLELVGKWDGNTFHGVSQTVLEKGYDKWTDETFTLIFDEKFTHAKVTFWYKIGDVTMLGSDFVYRQK